MAAASASACLCPAAANGETPAPPPGLSPVSPVSPVSIINVVQGFLLSGVGKGPDLTEDGPRPQQLNYSLTSRLLFARAINTTLRAPSTSVLHQSLAANAASARHMAPRRRASSAPVAATSAAAAAATAAATARRVSSARLAPIAGSTPGRPRTNRSRTAGNRASAAAADWWRYSWTSSASAGTAPMCARQKPTTSGSHSGGWIQGQEGWIQGQYGWIQGQYGWIQGQEGWIQRQDGWIQGQEGWIQGQEGWIQGQEGWIQGQERWIQRRRRGGFSGA
eukprot:1188751-Prorocentrum_minimum.AAC.1